MKEKILEALRRAAVRKVVVALVVAGLGALTISADPAIVDTLVTVAVEIGSSL